MTPLSSRRSGPLLRIALVGPLLASLSLVGAASSPSPVQEGMLLDGTPVRVEYQRSATSEDLDLPFYPEARTEKSFAYTVTTEEDKHVLRYACAVLITSDAPEQVAASYASQLPGNPQPETIESKEGKRLVLAVGTPGEVRTVTIMGHASGARIQLIRATEPEVPAAAPREPPRLRPPYRGPGRRGRRGGGRRGAAV